MANHFLIYWASNLVEWPFTVFPIIHSLAQMAKLCKNLAQKMAKDKFKLWYIMFQYTIMSDIEMKPLEGESYDDMSSAPPPTKKYKGTKFIMHQ